jgi:hypothetical protein
MMLNVVEDGRNSFMVEAELKLFQHFPVKNWPESLAIFQLPDRWAVRYLISDRPGLEASIDRGAR